MLNFQISPYFRIIRDETKGEALAYHALYGNPRILNEEALQFLSLFQEPTTSESVIDFCDEDPNPIIKELSSIFFLTETNFDEKKFLHEQKSKLLSQVSSGQTVDRMGLAISDSCNFGCTHCLHFQPLTNNGRVLPMYDKPHDQLNMSWETARRCVDKFVNLMRQNNQNSGQIHFGNAEPLINWPVIREVLEYCSHISDMTFRFIINTNLALLTAEIAQVFKEHRVEIATSLDGIAEANDAIRITKGGKGTFDSILKKFDLLVETGYPLDGFSITVTAGNFDLVDTSIIDLAAERHMTSIAFDYDLVSLVDIPLESKVSKLMQLKKYANHRGIEFFGTWDAPFRNLTSASLLTGNHAFCAAVQGKSLEFNVDGSIKVCGHTTTKVGHIDQFDDMFKSNGGLFQMVQERFPGTDEYCSGCEIEGPCGGQCHVTREVVSRSRGELRQKMFTAMCDFYRAITKALALEYIRTGGIPSIGERRNCTI